MALRPDGFSELMRCFSARFSVSYGQKVLSRLSLRGKGFFSVKTIYLVKKDPRRPAGQDNWIIMDREAFARFLRTPQGTERKKEFGVLGHCGGGDAVIVAECGRAGARAWNAGRNRSRYLRQGTARRETGGVCETREYLPEELVPDTGPGVEEIIENRILLEQLRGAVSKLSPDERDLVLCLWLGDPPMTEAQYAGRAGLSRAQVNYRKKRVLGKLRRMLGAEPGPKR